MNKQNKLKEGDIILGYDGKLYYFLLYEIKGIYADPFVLFSGFAFFNLKISELTFNMNRIKLIKPGIWQYVY